MESRKTYTEDEKAQLLTNLEIEVKHRTRQLQAWLEDQLESFKMHQENTVSRIPKPVRAMTMREFGVKYHANTVLAATGSQKDRMAELGEIDKTERKRKWMAIQETTEDGESSRMSKTARLLSPKKKPGTSKTPAKPRPFAPSPSPQKSKPPFTTAFRPTSPSKLPLHKPPPTATRTRVPSSSTFNPTLPPKTPQYPRHAHNSSGTLRMPRKDEQMLSVNGSPLANPLWADTGTGVHSDGLGLGVGGGSRTLKRTQSNISIRRDPSFVSGLPPRADSQNSFYNNNSHSRANSDATLAESYNGLPSSSSSSSSFETPYQTNKYAVTISTKDGHILELDPLQTSPGMLDKLDGITDSAKKQAREEMGRLTEAAVDKWRIR